MNNYTLTAELIQDVLNDGMNKELLLRETQIDEDTLTLKMDTDGFTPEENRVIRKTIKDWRNGQ